MPNTIDQTVSDYFAALRAMDIEAWVNTFAPTATSNDPVGAPPLVGHDGVRTFITGVFSLFTTLGLTEDTVFINGDTAAIKWTGAGVGKNGAAVTFEGIDVITVDEATGKITLVNAYWDPTPALTAVQA